MELSVIIVHYHTPELLKNCLASLFKFKPGKTEIIVVDNGSEDGLKAGITTAYPETVWIDAGYNSGFAKANNIGIRQAKGDYILLLNSDAVVTDHFLANFLAFYKSEDKHDKLGLLGCRIIGIDDQKLQVGSGIGFRGLKNVWHANPVYLFLSRKHKKENAYKPEIMHYQNHELDYISGCCVMIKKSKILKNNLYLDEDFFLYSEDVEWSYRIKKHGYYNYFCGDVEIHHVNGGSSVNKTNKKAQVQISEYLYYLKTNSLFRYYVIGMVLWMNFKLDLFLNRKRSDNVDIKNIAARFNTFKKYYFKIVKNPDISAKRNS